MLDIASDHFPPTFLERLEVLFKLSICIATIMAASNSNDADITKNSRPEFVKEFDNLTEISEPKIAPNEPPAMINPYNFLDCLSLKILITNTQKIDTTKKE
jgi:hypothetical protein